MRLSDTLPLHHQLCSRPKTAGHQHRVLNVSVASNEYRDPYSEPLHFLLANSPTSALVNGRVITVKREKLHTCANSVPRRRSRNLHPNCIASRLAMFEVKRGVSQMRMKRRLPRRTAPWKIQGMA
jgi:hypothetical protein